MTDDNTSFSISDAESVVMQVLWASEPQSAEQIVQALAQAQTWQEATVKTLLNRLLNKGAIRAEREGRKYWYFAVLQREQWVSQSTQSFVNRMFGGQISPLVAHFSQHHAMTEADMAKLRRLIEGMPGAR